MELDNNGTSQGTSEKRTTILEMTTYYRPTMIISHSIIIIDLQEELLQWVK